MFFIKSYKYQLNNWDSKKQKLNEIIEKIKFYQDKKSNLLTNYGSNNNYEADIIQILKEDIIKFFIEANLYNPYVSSLWFQQYNNEQYHLTHNHGALGYSSVLYINYDPKHHTATRFLSPYYSITGETITYVPEIKEGTLLVFPSMINHYTLPNQSQRTRTILSINFKENR